MTQAVTKLLRNMPESTFIAEWTRPESERRYSFNDLLAEAMRRGYNAQGKQVCPVAVRSLCPSCDGELTTTDHELGACTQCRAPIRPQRSEATMSKPRGHSNVHVDQTERYGDTDRAMIPIESGATVYTVKPLPPLSLSREEWQEIGERMGWAKYRLSADKEAEQRKRARA